MTGRLVLSVLLTVALGFALVALIVVPTVVAAALPLGALAGVMRFAVTLGTVDPGSPRSRHRPGTVAGVGVAAAVAAATLVLAGIAVTFGAATPALLVLAGIASGPWWWPRLRPHADRRPSRRPSVQPTPAGVRITAPPDPGPRPETLGSLPTTALCARWQRSYHAVHATDDPATRERIAAQRRALLDEFARRDPDGVTRWLATEPRPAATSPQRHLSGSGPPESS